MSDWMPTLSTVLEYLASASLVVSIVQVYLILNKLWGRKHEKVVAESQSIASNLLGLFTSFPWIVKYSLDGEIKTALVSAVWFLLTGFFTLVAIGFWVPASEQQSVWAKLKAALRLERTEASELLKALFRPEDAQAIVKILHQIALIDRHLDERERAYIETFAMNWGIESPFASTNTAATAHLEQGFTALRTSVENYLAQRPLQAQATQLRELLVAMVKADAKESEDEALILHEITGMIDAYITKDGAVPSHEVVLIPQSPEQAEAIRGLLQGATPESYRGGTAFVAGRYFSNDYAQMIRQKHQALGFFAVLDSRDQQSDSAS